MSRTAPASLNKHVSTPRSSNKENEPVPTRESRHRRVSAKVAEQRAQAAEHAARKEEVVARQVVRKRKVQVRKDKAGGITQDANASDLEPLEDTEITSRSVPTKISIATTKRALETLAAANIDVSPASSVVKRGSKIPPAPTQKLVYPEYGDYDYDDEDERDIYEDMDIDHPGDSDQDIHDDDSQLGFEEDEDEDRDAIGDDDQIYSGEVVNMGIPLSQTLRPLPGKPVPSRVVLNLRSEDSCPASVDARKVADKGGRPKASDYDDVGKDLILTSATIYRCLLSTIDAFPDSAKETEMVKTAWERANVDSEMSPPLTLTPDIAKIIKQRGSQTRGEAKAKTSGLVETLYNFASGQGRRTVAANRTLSEDLKFQKGFLYKILKDENNERKGLYQHDIIQKAVNKMWFQNKRDEGVMYSDLFNPLPVPAIALILTAIECNIDEWTTGSKTDVPFYSDDYREVYHKHIESLNVFGELTSKYKLLDTLQKRLHNYGRIHAGATPIAMKSVMAIPLSAIEAAIREYEEADKTDDDGEEALSQ